MYRGTYDAESDTGPWALVAQLMDRQNMPALSLDPGDMYYQEIDLDQNESFTVPLPQNNASSAKMYVAITCNLLTRVTYSSSVLGSNRKVLIRASDSTTDGDHRGFWIYQGDLTSLVISIPTTAHGGATTLVSVFCYMIPDLADSDSYYDREIGLGTA
jgi:hypothetical protein